jgi:LPS O-antigen subunit length determinant protein (WzzB/FepE family)
MIGDAASPDAATGTSPKEILLWFYAHWRILLASTLGAAILAAGISLLISRSYQASAVLRPIMLDNSGELLQGSFGNSFGGSVASSLLGGPRQADDASVTMAMMESPEFLQSFITKFKLADELLPEDSETAAERKGLSPKREERILGSLRNRIVITQRQDGLIELGLRWASPERAEQIERLFIAEVNKRKRELTLSRTKANLDYLEKRLQQETTTEMRMTTANLAGRQLAQIMLSQGPGDYAVEVVAAPYASQFPVAPPRKLITIMGAVIGFVGATLFLLALQAWKKS